MAYLRGTVASVRSLLLDEPLHDRDDAADVGAVAHERHGAVSGALDVSGWHNVPTPSRVLLLPLRVGPVFHEGCRAPSTLSEIQNEVEG